MAYLLVKSFHIVFVASWFAGLFYLPRIYVNLAMVPAESEAERARLREEFHRDAREALDEMEATGLGHDWDEVKTYFAQMAEYRAGRAPRTAALVPKKVL